MNDPELTKALQIIKLVKGELTRKDFTDAFKALLSAITRIERGLINRIDQRLAQIKDGKTPTINELQTLIRPLIPPVKDGEAPSDSKLLSLITPLIPAPEKGDDGSPDTADDIRNKLELLPEGEKLQIDAIEDLRKELDALKRTGSGSVIAYSRGQIKLYDLSDQLDGSKKKFALPSFWRVISVQSTSTPNAFRPGIDYNTDASDMSITFTDQIDAASTLSDGQSLLIMYAEP